MPTVGETVKHKSCSTVITKPYNHKLEKREEGGLEINLDIHMPTDARACITPLNHISVTEACSSIKSYWKIQMFSQSLL